jgi:outer membrane protein W
VKTWWWISAAVVLAAVWTLPARAQDDPTSAIGGTIAYGVPRDLERGVGVGVTWTHLVATLLSFEFGVEHYAYDDRDTDAGIVRGKVRETPLLVTAQIRPQFGWSPYLGFGLGYYLISYDQTTAATDSCLATVGEACEISVDSGVGVHFAAGFDVPLDDRLTLTLDFRSASGDADVTTRGLTSGVSSDSEMRLDYRKFGVGLKYWF